MNDSPATTESTSHGCSTRRTRHSRRDSLAMQINILLDALLWLAMRLNGRDAMELTVTDLARLFGLHGHNLTTLADLLGRAGALAPQTAQNICRAYDRGMYELLRYRGEPE